MAIQFPDSPAEGDQFTASNGVIYTYENGAWNGNSASGLEDVFVNISGDEMSGNLTVPSLNGGPFATNRLINGGLNVWQRGTSIAVAAGVNTFTADRWVFNSEAGGATTVSRNDDSNSPTGAGVTIGSGIGFLYQPIELVGSTNTQQFTGTYTLSFYITKPSVFGAICEYRDRSNSGTNSVSVSVPVPTATGEVVGAWERYSTTFDFDTANPTSTNTCLIIGPQFNGAAPVAITGLQLEPGPVATPTEHRPIGTELALCQRYFYKTPARVYACSLTYSGSDSSFGVATVKYPVTMRVVPTKENLVAIKGTLGNTMGSSVDGFCARITGTGTPGFTDSAALESGQTNDAEL